MKNAIRNNRRPGFTSRLESHDPVDDWPFPRCVLDTYKSKRNIRAVIAEAQTRNEYFNKREIARKTQLSLHTVNRLIKEMNDVAPYLKGSRKYRLTPKGLATHNSQRWQLGS